MALKVPRRYYLRQRQQAVRDEEWDLAGVWRTKQQAQPGTALPTDFPHLTRLAAQGYTTREDLDGATESELQLQGFSSREAKAILAAIALLVSEEGP